jgi:hypothetical protein
MPAKSLSSLKPREKFLAGFILNKLWTDKYWCGEGRRQHLGHTSRTNLPKGLPRSDAGEVQEVADTLIKLGFICKVSATGDIHVCASRAPEKLVEGLVTANEYRASVGLPPLKQNQI